MRRRCRPEWCAPGGPSAACRDPSGAWSPVRGRATMGAVDVNRVPDPDGWDDPITGLEGPAFWRRVLVAEVARATKYDRPLSVVVVELEGLQELWDAWGEALGGHALHEAAQCLRRAARASDYCTRIG